MGNVFLVAYDGADRGVVDMAIGLAKKQGAQLHIVHVLEWSPYSFLTPEELADRHKTRQSELTKADTAILQPILSHARASGCEASGEVRYGHVVDTVCTVAKEQQASMIFVQRSNALSDRVFGGVASGLAQCAPTPTVIVP